MQITTVELGLVATGWQISGVVWGNAIAMAVTGILYGICAWVLSCRVWGASPLQGSWQALRGRAREIAGLFVINELNVVLDMIPKYMDIIILGYFAAQRRQATINWRRVLQVD